MGDMDMGDTEDMVATIRATARFHFNPGTIEVTVDMAHLIINQDYMMATTGIIAACHWDGELQHKNFFELNV